MLVLNQPFVNYQIEVLLTDCDWLNLNTLLNMSICRIVGILARENLFTA